MVLLPTIICPLTQSPAINGELIAEEEARQLSFVVNNLNGRTMDRNDTTVDTGYSCCQECGLVVCGQINTMAIEIGNSSINL